MSSKLCKKPTSTTTSTARIAHSQDLGEAATWGRRRRRTSSTRRRRKGGFFGRMLNKVKKRGVGFLKRKATKLAKKLIFKLVNKLPKKVSFLRPVLRDLVSTMLTGRMDGKSLKKRFKKQLPRLGKKFFKSMKSRKFRSFMFHLLEKKLWKSGARKEKNGSKRLFWQAGDHTKLCFQTSRFITHPKYAVKFGYFKGRPGLPKSGKNGERRKTMIKAGVCSDKSTCGSAEDIKKGRGVIYFHRVLKKDPRNYCEVKFAPWARVCNTCCCRKGLVSSGLETSLAYVQPTAKVSCKGWYMIVVAYANAISGIGQRAQMAMALKAARCF